MTFWAISFKILVAGVKLHVYGSTQSPKGQMTVGVPLFGACYLRGFTVQRARVPRVLLLAPCWSVCIVLQDDA